MNPSGSTRWIWISLVLLGLIHLLHEPGWPALGPGTTRLAATEGDILVELFLPRDRKGDLPEIRSAFEQLSITRIRAQFFYPAGVPLRNIAIGRGVPAPIARSAIELALQYNQGIQLLVQQFRFPPYYIAIGTSAFDETAQIPIQPEDLKRLLDPDLTTEQFHRLYRKLTGEDQISSP